MESNELNPLWVFCRDCSSTDVSELNSLIDLHMDKINLLEGRNGDIKMTPLHAVLCSRKTVSRKCFEVRILIARGADVNCLDECGTSVLGYLTNNANREDLHADIIKFLEEKGGEIVRGQTTDFFFDLLCSDEYEENDDCDEELKDEI
jgi:hypothetical protein